MPEEVIETEQQEVKVEEETSSQSETTETLPLESQAEETGEQETTEEQVAETVEGETEPKPKDEKAKAESREAYLKRQLDKSNKELAEAKAKAETSPARQQEIQRQAQEADQQKVARYVQILGISEEQATFLINEQKEEARKIAASQVQPLTGTMYETQFERIKQELATDPDIVDMKSFDKEVQAIAQQYKVAGQAFYLGNKEVVKNIYLHLQGKNSKAMIAAAVERGRKLALQDKRIEGEVGMPRTAVNGGGNTGGITKADKDWAAKNLEKTDQASLEFARNLRLKREKAEKERNNQKK